MESPSMDEYMAYWENVSAREHEAYLRDEAFRKARGDERYTHADEDEGE